jgi:peptide/nickel transport system substrate-binding protein
MKKTKKISYLLLSLILAISVVGIVPVSAQDGSDAPYGPYPDTLIVFLHADESTVIPRIETGEMDGWLWWLNSENTELAEQNTAIDLVGGFGLYNGMQFNPLETTGGFNIFSIQEVREAMNWIIDRNVIVNEFHEGRGSPKWHIFKSVSPDYARTVATMLGLENEYAYNFDKGKTEIYNALEKAGAYLNATTGTWYYNNTEIEVNALIRIEDERLDAGDYLAGQLERLGFKVNYLHRSSGDAYQYWGVLAPSVAGDWHFYTAGWISTAMRAYEDDSPYYFNTPDNQPLYEIWQPTASLVEASTTLNDAGYLSMAERNNLVETCAALMLKVGTHVWTIDQLVAFPHSADLGDFVNDLYGAFHGYWGLKTIRRNEPGGTIKLGALSFWIEGFNPVGGFNWLYDVYAQYIVEDSGVYFHPHTGRAIPHRADFTVNTAGPAGTLSVPNDALMYDVFTDTYSPVGDGVSATSMVTYNMTWGQWHHGEAINMADVMMEIAEVYKITTPGTTTNLYDITTITPDRRIFTSNFKGIKWLSDTVCEVYSDYWHPDETYIAYYNDVWPTGPWEGVALGNNVVSQQLLAWSLDQADVRGVDMLDLVKGPSLPILETAYNSLATANYIPAAITDWVSSSDAMARWTAKGNWYDAWGNWWVSSGPYFVDTVNVDAYQITFSAFRQYPFKADAFDNMVTLSEPEVAFASVPTSVVPGLSAVFDLDVTVAGAPYENVDVTYLLIDQADAVMKEGMATNLGAGDFQVEITATDTSAMTAGSYRLLTLAVGEEYAVPTQTETIFTVIPELAYFQTLVATLESKVDAQGNTISSLESTIGQLNTSLAASQNNLNIALALSVIGLLIGGGGIALSQRKK